MDPQRSDAVDRFDLIRAPPQIDRLHRAVIKWEMTSLSFVAEAGLRWWLVLLCGLCVCRA